MAVSLTRFTRMKSPARSMSALASKYWGGDDVRCRVAAPEVPERRAIGIAEVARAAQNIAGLLAAIPDSLWWLFGAGYLGYTGARSFDKWRGVTR